MVVAMKYRSQQLLNRGKRLESSRAHGFQTPMDAWVEQSSGIELKEIGLNKR
jgi:hypothetical protein